MQSLVKSFATEFAPRIRVNSVVLGLIDSGQWERRFQARENYAGFDEIAQFVDRNPNWPRRATGEL